MTEPKLNYVGPLPEALTYERKVPLWRRVPLALLLVVVAPTLLAAVYFLLIASPRYVSEARFVVRSSNQTPSSLGMALQGVGISTGQSDAFAVHEYLTSADGLRDLQRSVDVAALLGRPGVDPFSRYPRVGEARSEEGLLKALNRLVVVGYDSSTGISTLRVEAFRPEDASQIASLLLDSGESLVNRLNERSVNDAVRQARVTRENAVRNLTQAQAALTDFRNQQEFIDPQTLVTENAELVGQLNARIAELQAERSQVASQAPDSPQLPAIDARIAAYNRQVATERSKVAGGTATLAPKVGAYEELSFNRELATRELAAATTSLLAAEQEARRKQAYLERVVSPNLPQTPLEPRRWLSVLAVLATSLLLYGLGWLVWAGVREHRQV
ncbi:chain-length determining protein [Brevundimonas sp. SL130]|uniref:chain-length determining protein n=1 Tax=Brevundimonas sp. SL130 TaxID=2995143 RepID=UPI00226D3B30|nr:chain-length determining protein [Brevundimonas sp. SL130]WAC60328.1 chain-length determining protein [Brevundimonas sp. SL130]